jgi:hypothetical protein
MGVNFLHISHWLSAEFTPNQNRCNISKKIGVKSSFYTSVIALEMQLRFVFFFFSQFDYMVICNVVFKPPLIVIIQRFVQSISLPLSPPLNSYVASSTKRATQHIFLFFLLLLSTQYKI